MLSPVDVFSAELRILSSVFKCSLIPLRGDPGEVISSFKKEYPKADHYPYAYIYLGEERCGDDGEPGGSAGLPYLEILRKRGISDAILITARYFGGTKLGAGRLKHVFKDVALEAVNQAEFAEIIDGPAYRLVADFERSMLAESVLRSEKIEFEKEEMTNSIAFTFVPSGKIGALPRLGAYGELTELGLRRSYVCKDSSK